MRKISECYRKLEWDEIAKKGNVRLQKNFKELFVNENSCLIINARELKFYIEKGCLRVALHSYERLK